MGAEESKPPMSHNDLLVVVRPAMARQETATNESLRLVGGGCGEGGRTGARRTGAGASEPPTSHNDSLVVVVEREGEPGLRGRGLRRANHQQVITTRWWW